MATGTVSNAAGFSDLPGCELSAVCFVRDYVEFHFDGPILRALADPILTAAARRYEFPSPGSRDGLCALIGKVVDSAEDDPARLLVTFTDGSRIEIKKTSRISGAEIAHFVPTIAGERHVASMMIWGNPLPTKPN